MLMLRELAQKRVEATCTKCSNKSYFKANDVLICNDCKTRLSRCTDLIELKFSRYNYYADSE